MHRTKPLLLVLFFFLWRFLLPAQNPGKLTDGRYSDPFCLEYQRLVESRPKEVLFGVHIHDNGEIFFQMDSEAWFKKLFGKGMGITVDLVSKDRYDCEHYHADTGF
ncbi:MAG TPA: hypothetical protein VNW04_06780, partial [Puia sp.]|nr:hypothetical protein [Puia sp.]